MHEVSDGSFVDVESAHLRAWLKLSTSDRIDFFEEMVELAFLTGALQPDRLKLRDLSS